jgi:AcrR family transcriptional regulator
MPRIADRRAKIDLLRAAEEAFAEHGLAAAKVEDITARAGVSKGAFYLHFESKEDCFRQIVEGVLARIAATAGDLEQLDIPTLDDLPAMLEKGLAVDVEVLELCWQNRAILRMILAGGGGAPYAYLLDAFGEQIIGRSERWVEHAIRMGLYRSDIDPALVARLVSGTYERLVRELIKQPRRPDTAAWARQVQALITRGLFAPEVSAFVDRKVIHAREQAEESRGTTKTKTKAKAKVG